MTIHFFTKGDRMIGSSRQRAFLVAEELNKRGFQSVVHQPPVVLLSQVAWSRKLSLLKRYLRIFSKIKKEDIVFIQRAIYNKHFFALLILYKLIYRRRIIFDFDDAIYLHSQAKTKILTTLADVVIVGSHRLYDWASKFNRNVYLIPTSVYFDIYSRHTKSYDAASQTVVIGWVGNVVAHYDNLKILVPVFEKLVSKKLDFKFILVGSLGSEKVYSLFNSIKGLEVEFVDTLNWSDLEEVPRIIQRFDVGLMPLLDTEWNRGKCAFKAIEYMACGVATICSAVGESNYLIKDGINGFLAKDAKEWYNKLELLILNKEIRKKLGKNGQITIRDNYSYQVNISKLISVLQSL